MIPPHLPRPRIGRFLPALAALVLLAFASVARADAPDFPDPSGDWSGSYLVPNEDGSPRWWGDIDISVDANGQIHGTGDLTNHHGDYFTLVIQGVVVPDGRLMLVNFDSAGDTVICLSIESSIVGDTWVVDFRLEATYDVLPGRMVMFR